MMSLLNLKNILHESFLREIHPRSTIQNCDQMTLGRPCKLSLELKIELGENHKKIFKIILPFPEDHPPPPLDFPEDQPFELPPPPNFEPRLPKLPNVADTEATDANANKHTKIYATHESKSNKKSWSMFKLQLLTQQK